MPFSDHSEHSHPSQSSNTREENPHQTQTDFKKHILTYFSETNTAPECRKFVENLRPVFFHQLAGMGENATYAPKENNNHLTYEERMLQFVDGNAEHIIALLFPDQLDHIAVPRSSVVLTPYNVLGYLKICILLSDVGKMGWEVLDTTKPSSVVSRIYREVLMFTPQIEWMARHIPNEPKLASFFAEGRYAAVPIEVCVDIAKHTAIEQLYAQLTQPTLPEQLEMQFNGTYLDTRRVEEIFEKRGIDCSELTAERHTMRTILKTRTYQELEKTLDDIFTMYTISDEERVALLDKNIDVTKTPIGAFWTRAHLQFGNEFLKRFALTSDQDAVAQLAMLHHLSQNVVLSDSVPLLDQASPELLRFIAFTEILDKADARINRTNYLPLESILNLVEQEISSGILRNYGEGTQIEEIYLDLMHGMRQSLQYSQLVES